MNSAYSDNIYEKNKYPTITAFINDC